MERRRTSTSNFGVGKRESHDSSAFYGRFRPPLLSDDDTVPVPQPVREPFLCGDSRHMDEVPDGSVALVVTSPPYFAGKAYEEELDREGVPSSYLEYLELLGEVFAECVRKLEPGGRIAVNVANLGRKPYRSLSSDVIRILQDDLGLLLRGEVVWQKGEGANGSCAWGSFRSATNPVLRDITERVVIASKGRFDRARSAKARAAEGLPFESTVMTEDFLSLTLDLWSIPPESAKRVGHPAPFPVELPEQLIRLYTFAGDLVLDPFMGSGSTMVAAARLGRRYVGYDLDPAYVEIARERVEGLDHEDGARGEAPSAATVPDPEHGPRIRREGKAAHRVAADALERAGFVLVAESHKVPKSGVTVSFVARDALAAEWYVDVPGSFTSYRGGLQRPETVFRALGRANAIHGRVGPKPVLLLATHLPRRASEGDLALRAAGPRSVFDVIDLLDEGALERLGEYARRGATAGPLPGFWSPAELEIAGVTGLTTRP